MQTEERKEPSLFGSIGSTIGSFLGRAEQNVVLKVDHVLEAFHDTLAKLDHVAKTHTEEAAEHLRVIQERTAKKLEAEAEAARATSIAKKFKALLN